MRSILELLWPENITDGLINTYDYKLAKDLLTPIAILCAGYLFFVLWRIVRLRRTYRRIAKKKTADFVRTAGPLLGDVVGRDDLCRAIMEDLRDRDNRRPHVIVGGIGAGKTAMIVRLTGMLAKKGAIPVPIRLRDYDKSLNFREAAKQRFCEEAKLFKFSMWNTESIWQYLCDNDQIVVLADGLEEALQDLGVVHEHERDNLIRVAIDRAKRDNLPIVIASRPYKALNGMDASMTLLEPLSERDALGYLRKEGEVENEPRLRAIVEQAEISHSPLYLQITNQLNKAGLLHRVTPGRDHHLDSRGVDLVGLRLRLLDTWVHAVNDCYLRDTITLDANDRKATVLQLSALACVGLMMDSLYVKFTDFNQPSELEEYMRRRDPDRLESEEQKRYKKQQAYNSKHYKGILTQLRDELRQLDRRLDLQLAATRGQQLGFVEPFGDGVRFPHSILQAYLGSHYMEAALDNSAYLNTALMQSGREFLLSLTMYARRRADRPDLVAATRWDSAHLFHPRPLPTAWIPEYPDGAVSTLDEIVTRLCDEAENRWHALAGSDAKFLELYTHALEIIPDTEQESFAEKIRKIRLHVCETQQKPSTQAADPCTLEQERLELVYRLGEAIRRAGAKDTFRESERRDDLLESYREMVRLSHCEPSYAVRLALAQEIGAGGDLAHEALETQLDPIPPSAQLQFDCVREPGAGLPDLRGKLPEGQHPVIRATTPLGPAPGGVQVEAFVQLKDSREELEARYQYRSVAQGNVYYEHRLRTSTMRAWLAPLLVSSVKGKGRSRDAREKLETWVDAVAGSCKRLEFPLNTKIALVQGFKSSANLRLGGPRCNPESLKYLAEQARQMLHRVDFWYSRLALLQALTLWSLSQSNDESADDQELPNAVVRQWRIMSKEETERVRRSESLTEHPFVYHAADLCTLALTSKQPERFLWIDESGLLAKTGSGPPTDTDPPRRDRWIPLSAGWSGLDPRAQQLAADVLILLNTAEGGDLGPRERERRLAATATTRLPRCLTKDRELLDPLRTRKPGNETSCKCLLDLCPYPVKGKQPPRAELSEAFCRRQKVILGLPTNIRVKLRVSRTAPWQGQTPRQLKAFWDDMRERARR
ncbi:hypothetical protein [Actinopolymorpha cephalotaxi]|uniref:hypothetical protein n=1 Tax=Actinopolymorpha cephalotaxi TaxID=504797 RepID=UPI00192CFB36